MGDWVVDALSGAPPGSHDYPILVTFQAGTVRAQSQCVPFGWRYTLSRTGFATTPDPDPRPVCDRVRSPWEDRFQSVMAAADRAGVRPDGALLISGAGGQALLRRKAAR